MLGYGRHDAIEYLLMTRMPGVAAVTVDLTGAHRAVVLRELGERCAASTRCPRRLSMAARFPGDRTRAAFVARARKPWPMRHRFLAQRLTCGASRAHQRTWRHGCWRNSLPPSIWWRCTRTPAGPYLCSARDAGLCWPDRFRRCVHWSPRTRLAVANSCGPRRPAARLRCRHASHQRVCGWVARRPDVERYGVARDAAGNKAPGTGAVTRSAHDRGVISVLLATWQATAPQKGISCRGVTISRNYASPVKVRILTY